MSGKSTIARELSKKLKIHWIDIDDNIRFPLFGLPHPHPNSSPELMARDQEEVLLSYGVLLNAIENYIHLGRSLIVTATFSRETGQEKLREICEKYPNVEMKVLWCLPNADTTEEIQKRLSSRVFGENCFSSVNSLKRYNEVKNRFEPIKLPHHKLDTTMPLNKCLKDALAYLISKPRG